MCNLPENERLDFLQNKKLELVCFAAYQVMLHFEGGVLITIFGSFTHIVAGKTIPVKNTGFPIENSDLMRLLELQIKEVQTQSDSTLTLEFANGDQLIIQGDNDAYEAYHIKHGERVIIV